MHIAQSDSTSDVGDVAGGQAVGTVTPGSTGDIKLPPKQGTEALQRQLPRGCFLLQAEKKLTQFRIFLIGFLFMFLSLTILTSQHTRSCNVSNFRGWALSLGHRTAGCHVEWTGSAGEALRAPCRARRGQAPNRRSLVNARNL